MQLQLRQQTRASVICYWIVNNIADRAGIHQHIGFIRDMDRIKVTSRKHKQDESPKDKKNWLLWHVLDAK